VEPSAASLAIWVSVACSWTVAFIVAQTDRIPSSNFTNDCAAATPMPTMAADSIDASRPSCVIAPPQFLILLDAERLWLPMSFAAAMAALRPDVYLVLSRSRYATS